MGIFNAFRKKARHEKSLCLTADLKNREKKLAREVVSNIELTIEHSFSVRDVEIVQQTKGQMQPFSVDAWDGYVSPSGGYVNFARYQVIGINPKTKRRNKRIYDEQSEDRALKKAEDDGFVAPFEITIIPFDPPSERQLSYAKDLGISIPDGACWMDVSALISRVTSGHERPADEKTAMQAHLHGVKFSRYHNWGDILSQAEKLPSDIFGDFLDSIKPH